MVIKRVLRLPNRSFLLLGPRGSGKSTLIRKQIKAALEIDLLKSKNFLALSANPSLLEEWTAKLPGGAWVYIDEIQKIPALMDEVHSLYESRKLNFALSGSSARKLRRGGANLLAGRAISTQLFPCTFTEYAKHLDLKDAAEWGTLPQAITEPEFRRDFLASYVETYLREELVEEGIIRRLEPFARFLQVVGLYNGQILNVENIARECHVGRTTVDKYFEILEETLLGFRLPSLRAKWNAKELTHPKFYLFDPGVARGCAGLLGDDLDPAWLGFAFETLVVNEVKAHNAYLKTHRELFYYKQSGGYEIDLLIQTKRKTLSSPAEFTAIEIKAGKTWDKRWNDALTDCQAKSKGKIKRLIGVYRGTKRFEQGGVEVLPVEEFFTRLAQGEFLS